jgi:hypothetical protein
MGTGIPSLCRALMEGSTDSGLGAPRSVEERVPPPGEPSTLRRQALPHLLQHMSQSHPAELQPYLAQMEHSDDITAIIVQAYDVVDGTP